MSEPQELSQRAFAWGMSSQALANLLTCGKNTMKGVGKNADPECHHLRFEAQKIFLRVMIRGKKIEERLPDDLDKAKQARDQRLIALNFDIKLFHKNRTAYHNAKAKSKR